MSPALLLPAALGALIAVLLPLAIHVARSTETRTINFAALRWLDPNPKPVRRWRLEEPWLLAVRITLIAALALLLARPVLWGFSDGKPIVAVSPGVDPRSVEDGAARRVWLAPGFPGIDQPPPPTPNDFASLVRQLDAETPSGTPIKVVVPPLLSGVDAERPRLSRKIEWLIAPSARRAVALPAPEPLELTVRHGSQAQDGVRYFRAAAVAWAPAGQPPRLDAAPTDQPLPVKARYLVWLSSAPISAEALNWVEAGGVVLLSQTTPSPVEGGRRVVWRDVVGKPLATSGQFGKGRVLQLSRVLEPAAMPELVDADFPDALSFLLDPSPPPALVAAIDHAPTTGAAPYETPPFDLRPWLALIIALGFCVERWLATRRRRAVAP